MLLCRFNDALFHLLSPEGLSSLRLLLVTKSLCDSVSISSLGFFF